MTECGAGRTSGERIIFAIGLVAAIASGVVAYHQGGRYGDKNDLDPRVRRIYDTATGRLKVVVFDSDGDLKFDTWSYMDGDRLLRMDVDENEDGTIDGREYYGSEKELQRIERLAPDGHVTSTEFYENGTLIRTELSANARK